LCYQPSYNINHLFQHISVKNRYKCKFSLTLEKPSKNYTCIVLRRFGLFLIHLQSKNKATRNVSNSKPKRFVTHKMSKAKPGRGQPTNSYADKVKTKPA